MSEPITSALIISFSDINRDPRVLRQVNWMRDAFQLSVAGFGASPGSIKEFVSVSPIGRSRNGKIIGVLLLLLRWFNFFYWSDPKVKSALNGLVGKRFDVIIANDLDSLPLALHVANGAPVLVDAHEYAPREYEDRWVWRLLFQRYRTYLCETYLKRSQAMLTVCSSIAEEYAKNFKVSPVVVTNSPNYKAIGPSPIDASHIRIIHHGAAVRSRHIELMIQMFEHLDDRFSLDLMLLSEDQRYMAELREIASRYGRIRFLDPVPMPAIIETINSYDIGLYLLPPVNFNHAHALPNKFFEFVQARLAVAIGPSPEMAKLVKAHKLGVVAESFDAMELARKLNSLTKQDIEGYKRAAHQAASVLCAESNASVFLSKVQCLAGGAKANDCVGANDNGRS